MNEQKSRAKILVKNTAWIYAGKLATQLFGIIATILVIRKLAVDVYGTYNFLLKILLLYYVFAISPIVNIFNRYIPELIQNNDFRRFKKLIFVGITISTVLVFIISILVYVFSHPFSELFNIESLRLYFLALMIYVIATFYKRLFLSILTSSLLHNKAAILMTVSSLIRSLLLVALLKIIDVNLLLSIEAIFSLAFFLPAIFILLKYYHRNRLTAAPVVDDPNIRRRVYKYGLYSSLNELGYGIVGQESDFYIISSMSNQYQVGLYSFGSYIYEIVFKVLPVQEFLSVLRPVYYQKFSLKHSSEEFIGIFNFILKLILPVFIFPTMYFVVFGKPVIEYIFDPKYLDAYWISVLVLFSNITLAFFLPNNLVLELKERMDIALLSKIVVVFSIAAGILAMKHFGIVGVAAATLVGNFMRELFVFLILRRSVTIKYRIWELRNYLFVFILCSLPFFLITNFITSLYLLMFFSAIYTIIIFVCIIFFHPFTESDLVLLQKLSDSTSVSRKLGQLIRALYNIKPRL